MKRTLFFLSALTAVALGACTSVSQSSDKTSQDAVMQNILSRKSVRSFTGEPITDGQIETLLRAAMAAPSGSDIRPWSFVVLRDRSRYTEVFSESNFNLRIYDMSSAVFVMCADTTVRNRPNGTWRDDLGAATENLLLAAESMGLGAVWTACYPYDIRMDPIKKALELPDNVVPYAVVPVGHPDGETAPKDKWDASRIHYEKW